MATAWSIRHGYAAGAGAGPVWARPGFGVQPDLMPILSWPNYEKFPWDSGVHAWQTRWLLPIARQGIGLYAIVDSVSHLEQALAVGIRTVQLRIKIPMNADKAWDAQLEKTLIYSAKLCRDAGAFLIINDHINIALKIASESQRAKDWLGLHLGQEDLTMLEPRERDLIATRVQLGISSHSLWELARARCLQPAYIACGPVWPTLTKAMPWHAQGLDNLAWWVHMAGCPVVAIGGILESEKIEQAARTRASGVCVVRGLGDDLSVTVPKMREALMRGRQLPQVPVPDLPHPSLGNMLTHSFD
jgi:hydroxymethylpyrimidine kinase/phosphomethylpyrimidine kinase/thiamine-phosphate diphosphorylase